LTIVNLKYDLTPAENISMILCELGKIPAISVPVVVRESHKEIDEYVKDSLSDGESDD
jgi:translation initiation factor 2B subunit (eIF-2B alpha/beta/delta family)